MKHRVFKTTLLLCFLLLSAIACKDDDGTGGPIDEPMDEPMDNPTDDPMDEPTDEPTDDPMDEPTDDLPYVSTQPNILLVIADDVGLDATPGYDVGTLKPNMPHLEALQANGLTFENAWSYPVCAPTRASIITGKHGVKTGVLNVGFSLALSETTIQSYLDENLEKVYAHSLIGKWHLSNGPNRPNQMGIDYFSGIISGGTASYFNWDLVTNGEEEIETSYITEKLTDLAIDWIGEQEGPWFTWLAYTAPHTPFHVPPAEMHTQGDLPSDEASIEADSLPYYLAMMEALDFQLGRLLDSIPDDERENTIIIFVGDNGTPGQVAQSPLTSQSAKGSLHTGGVNVPLVVSGSGVTRVGERDTRLVSTVDFFSTIAEIAGVEESTYENSRSFVRSFSSSNAEAQEFIYAEVLNTNNPSRSGYTIRNEQYKLNVFDSGTERLYNIESDPFEMDNLNNSGLSAEAQSNYDALAERALEIRTE